MNGGSRIATAALLIACLAALGGDGQRPVPGERRTERLAALSSFGAADSSSADALRRTKSFSEIYGPTGIMQSLSSYGCANAEVIQRRDHATQWAARVYQVQRKLWGHWPNDVVGLAQNQLAPPGSTFWTAWWSDVAVIRYWLHDLPVGAVRIGIVDRADVASKANGRKLSPGDARFDLDRSGCPAGTHSHDAANPGPSGGGCTWGAVPICHGGARDGMWAPFDLGTTDNPYCPGGRVALMDRDPAWTATVPAATYAAQMREFSAMELSPNTNYRDPSQFCDGGITKKNESGCGSNPPSDLPPQSIGRALYRLTGSWPLPRMPIYYLANVTGGPGGYVGGVSAVVIDLRGEEARRYAVALFLDKAYHVLRSVPLDAEAARRVPLQIQDPCEKPGWYGYYPGYDGDAPACRGNAVHGTHMWTGPARPSLGAACYNNGGPIADTFYGPGEYEAVCGSLILGILHQTEPSPRVCSATASNPYEPCAADADCEGGRCEPNPTPYFTDLHVGIAEAPSYRNRPNELVPLAALRHPRFDGKRLTAHYYGSPPFSTGEAVCAANEPVRALAGGSYRTAAHSGLILVGRCEGPSDVVASWAPVSGCSGVSLSDPTDVQATLTGTRAATCVERLTCSSAVAGTRASDDARIAIGGPSS